MKIGLELEIVPKCYSSSSFSLCPTSSRCRDCDPNAPIYCTEYCDWINEFDCLEHCETCSRWDGRCLECLINCKGSIECGSCERRLMRICMSLYEGCSENDICDDCREFFSCEDCIDEIFPNILELLQRRYHCGDSRSYSLENEIIYVVPDESMPGLEVVTKPLDPEELIQLHARLVRELKKDFEISPRWGCGGHLTANLEDRAFTEQEILRVGLLTREFLPVLAYRSCEIPDTRFRQSWFRDYPKLNRLSEVKYQALRVKRDNHLIEFRYPDATTNSSIFRRAVEDIEKIVDFALSEKGVPKSTLAESIRKTLYFNIIYRGDPGGEGEFEILKKEFEEFLC